MLSIAMHLKHRGNRKENLRELIIHMLNFSYPLILCIELQCSVSQQERLAQLLIEVFAEKLYLDQVIGEIDPNLNEYRPLPSPNDLRGKVLIKVKDKEFEKGRKHFFFCS